MKPVLMIDNYDSFVFNLVRYVRELEYPIVVKRNDSLSLDEIATINPSHIMISPGPCSPTEAGLSNAVIKHFAGQVPIFGICLGHQCIGQVFGGKVKRALKPIHGKVHHIQHQQAGVFTDLPNPLPVTRYHSLIVERETLPDDLLITATTQEGEIMGLAHRTLPVVGVQFHPEAELTVGGHQLLRNFLMGHYR